MPCRLPSLHFSFHLRMIKAHYIKNTLVCYITKTAPTCSVYAKNDLQLTYKLRSNFQTCLLHLTFILPKRKKKSNGIIKKDKIGRPPTMRESLKIANYGLPSTGPSCFFSFEKMSEEEMRRVCWRKRRISCSWGAAPDQKQSKGKNSLNWNSLNGEEEGRDGDWLRGILYALFSTQKKRLSLILQFFMPIAE